MSQIFISYSHDDTPFVSKLAHDLLDHGYDVWMDALNLPGGVKWEDDILNAIDACDIYLLIWSANIEGSQMSQKEKDRAIRGGKHVIPIMRSGDPNRMWADIKSLQWIDFQTDYRTGWTKLVSQVALPSGVQPPPPLKTLIDRGDMTFAAAARLWRSKLPYRVGTPTEAIALLVERSEDAIYSYLVGKNTEFINVHPAIRLFMNFTGRVEGDRFEDYLDYLQANQLSTWTALIRGPITTTSRGLEYTMPYEKPVWNTAVQMAWKVVSLMGTDRIPLHLYLNAPVAMAAAFCAREHFKRDVHIYQVDLSASTAKDRYFEAYTYSFGR